MEHLRPPLALALARILLTSPPIEQPGRRGDGGIGGMLLIEGIATGLFVL
jgi:hypothetical protein